MNFIERWKLKTGFIAKIKKYPDRDIVEPLRFPDTKIYYCTKYNTVAFKCMNDCLQCKNSVPVDNFKIETHRNVKGYEEFSYHVLIGCEWKIINPLPKELRMTPEMYKRCRDFEVDIEKRR